MLIWQPITWYFPKREPSSKQKLEAKKATDGIYSERNYLVKTISGMKNWYFTFEVWKYQSLCLKSSRWFSTKGIYPVVEQLEGNVRNRETWTQHPVTLVTRQWRSDTWEVGPEPSCQIPHLAICWGGALAGSRDQWWYHFWQITEELFEGGGWMKAGLSLIPSLLMERAHFWHQRTEK